MGNPVAFKRAVIGSQKFKMAAKKEKPISQLPYLIESYNLGYFRV